MDAGEEVNYELDLNVMHYSLVELAEALEVSPNATRAEVVMAANARLREVNTPQMLAFFEQAKEQLLVLQQQQNISVKSVSRILNLDSAFRADPGVDNQDSDNYTCTLSERLPGVLSMTLLSVEIPQTWYTFSLAKGTSAVLFQCIDQDESGIDYVFKEEVVLQDGNYSNLSLLAILQEKLNAVIPRTIRFGNGTYGTGPWLTLVQDPIDGKLRITYTNFDATLNLKWYDPLQQSTALANAKSNYNLGWELGFRSDTTEIPFERNDAGEYMPQTVTAPSLLVAVGTRYITIRIDDHTASRLTNGTVSVGELNKQISLPNYSKARGSTAHEVGAFVNLPQGNKQLTFKQLYTVNSINKRILSKRGRIEANDTDFFAKIPLKRQTDWSNYSNGVVTLNEDGPGKVSVEMGGTLQRNRRVYNGPVNLNALTVSLHDDRGNNLGLNGHDWSCSIEIETLPPA